MFDHVSLENTRFSPRSLNMNSIIIDSMQQRKFEVHTPFHFAEGAGTRTSITYTIATHFYDKAHPKTIIVLAEAGNNQDKRSSPINTVSGLASQWSPGLPNGLVNESK